MLDSRRNDMTAARTACAQITEDGQVVRFRAAARKDDVLRIHIQNGRHLTPCRLHGCPCGLPEAVQTGRIAEFTCQIRHHRRQDAFIKRRCCRIVQVYALHANLLIKIYLLSYHIGALPTR